MVTESKKRLALAIHDFLSTSLVDGTLSADDKESIEVAQSCIAESFHIDPTDQAAVQDALGGQSLLSIYGVYEKLKGRGASSAGPSSSGSTSTTTAAPSETQQAEAEGLKSQGNGAMARKDYAAAIEAYTKALALVPQNPVYLSNRAAAFSASHQHDKAKADAQAAVAVDPKYTKAWSRLGLALFALGDAQGSMDAYAQGIEHEGSGGSDAMKKGYETAKRKVEEEGSNSMDPSGSGLGSARGPAAGAGAGGMPDLSSLASMLGGGGGAGAGAGGGGMPDLGGLMNNPMFANMAQKLMSNPQMMNNIMNNPRMREMAEGFGRGGGAGAGGAGGGGMPDLSALMSDPSIAEMARNMMGGGAGGAGAGAGAGRGGAGAGAGT
ncbi:MAG: hypothetical protein M1838_000350 [Thelocarpon superellum]|nr:MAG: hypothetical protein M1838_000350 [Thelocarpon superellum]